MQQLLLTDSGEMDGETLVCGLKIENLQLGFTSQGMIINHVLISNHEEVSKHAPPKKRLTLLSMQLDQFLSWKPQLSRPFLAWTPLARDQSLDLRTLRKRASSQDHCAGVPLFVIPQFNDIGSFCLNLHYSRHMNFNLDSARRISKKECYSGAN